MKNVIVGWIPECLFHPIHCIFEHPGKLGSFRFWHIFKSRTVRTGKYPGFIRKTGSERSERHEKLVIFNNAFPGRQLLSYQIAKNAPLFLLKKITTGGKFQFDIPWSDGRSNELRVRVGKRCTCDLTMIFKNENVTETRVSLKIFQPMFVRPAAFLNLGDA